MSAVTAALERVMFIAVYLSQVHAICIDTQVLQLLTAAAGRQNAEVLVKALVEAADTVVSPSAPLSVSLAAFANMLKPCLSNPSLGHDFRLQQLQVPHCTTWNVCMTQPVLQLPCLPLLVQALWPNQDC